ncbi:MAG: hypothetical protein V1726_06120 [Methanobacteriota archaeon]
MGTKIKTRYDILTDIIQEAKHYREGWYAAFGQDRERLSTDCYISHPAVGIYLLKEYEKNPFQRIGLGTKLVHHLDEDIEHRLQKHHSDFGIIQGNFQKILWNIRRGATPETILNAAIKGDDLGLSIPVKGQASRSPDTFTSFHENYASQQKNLNKKFEKMMAEDGAYNSYS